MSEIMLEMTNVTKQFVKGKRIVTAVRDVSLAIRREEIFALVGESGSGKSTIAEMAIGLQKPTRGSIVRHGKDAQIIFQNPDRSLNPYWQVKEIVVEPLLLRRLSRAEAYAQTAQLLARVKLPASLLERRPAECSGGQKQRIAIARALALSSQLLIADEITSALDPATEGEILRLLLTLKHQQRIAVLYITHRLESIARFADRVAVMKEGVIVEMGPVEQVLTNPQSEYTRQLLDAGRYRD